METVCHLIESKENAMLCLQTFLPKMQSLNLITRKHETSLDWGTFYKTKPDSLQKYQGHENQGKTRNYLRLKETQQTRQLNRMGVLTGPFCRREWATPGGSRMRSEDWSVVMYQGNFLTSCLHRGHREECLCRNGILSFQR